VFSSLVSLQYSQKPGVDKTRILKKVPRFIKNRDEGRSTR